MHGQNTTRMFIKHQRHRVSRQLPPLRRHASSAHPAATARELRGGCRKARRARTAARPPVTRAR